MHSTHNPKVLPWMSHWQTTIGSPNTAEMYRRPNRGTRGYKTDLIISKVWTLGKQLIRMYLTAIAFRSTDQCSESIIPLETTVFVFLYRCR